MPQEVVPGAFRRALLTWFARNGRDLPWRRTRDPYRILVSEVMLQQTQVGAVLSYYNEWLRRFPDFAGLAHAREAAVLRVWEGLGYYARARNLHRCSKKVVREFAGELPPEPEKLRQLPGIGRYTANAVAVFAHNRSLPLIEANTARVLSRLASIADCSSVAREKLWTLSARLGPKRGAARFHSALMDLGALICLPQNPRCSICPVRKFCATTGRLTGPKSRPKQIALTESHAFIRRNGALLLAKCSTRWRGMWMLPAANTTIATPIYLACFPFTHHQVSLQVFAQNPRPAEANEKWIPLQTLPSVPIPTPHRRAISILLANEQSRLRPDCH